MSFPLCENCKSARLRTRLVRFGTAFLFAVPFLPGFVSARTDAAETTAAWWLLGAAIAGFAVGWRIWMLVPRASDMFERGRRANDPAAMRVATPVEIGAAEGPPPEEGYPWVTFSFVDGDYGRDFEQANL